MSTPDPFHYYAIRGSDRWEHWRALEDRGLVEFWDGQDWRVSVLPNRVAFLDDALGGGATVREVLDPEEVPGRAREVTQAPWAWGSHDPVRDFQNQWPAVPVIAVELPGEPA